MRAATRMMLMGNKSAAANNVNGHNYQNGDFSAMTGRVGQKGRTAERMRPAKMGGEEYRGGMRERYESDDDDDEYRSPKHYEGGEDWSDPERKKYGKAHHGKVDESTAMEWVHKMKAGDGAPMPKYKHEQTEQMRKAHCPECDEWEWFVAVNMMYADYSEAAKKVNANRDEFYALMAKAFLMDEDAGPNKLIKYMEAIPKK